MYKSCLCVIAIQVIDVLQSAADDEPKPGHVLTPSTPLSATSTHSSGFVYTVPPPESGAMQMASYAFPRERTPRKSRKHTNSPQISPTVKQSAGPVDQEYKGNYNFHFFEGSITIVAPLPTPAPVFFPMGFQNYMLKSFFIQYFIVPTLSGTCDVEAKIDQ